VSADPPLRLAPGVRLRKDANGTYLLVPEGVLELSASATATLELIDGSRTLEDVVCELEREFDAAPGEVRADVVQLCATLLERGFLRT
jgi:coenzyme PQQ biosynthesis protein PqqD